MPIAADPNQRFEIVLESDQALPEDERPVFVYRYLVKRKLGPIASLVERVTHAATDGDMPGHDELFDAIRTGLVDWRHMTDPEKQQELAFDAARLEDLLTPGEAMEILFQLHFQGFGLEDKKKSASA